MLKFRQYLGESMLELREGHGGGTNAAPPAPPRPPPPSVPPNPDTTAGRPPEGVDYDIWLIMNYWGTNGPLGDFNNDGIVDYRDILWVLKFWDDPGDLYGGGNTRSKYNMKAHAGGKPKPPDEPFIEV